jgi:predicted SAM-dependent methyltransferase
MNILWNDLNNLLKSLLSEDNASRQTPHRPEIIRDSIQDYIRTGVRFVNIGGGRDFNCSTWLNLDSGPGGTFGLRFDLEQNQAIPVLDRSIQLVYSSHALEHLSDKAARRVLDESYRILDDGGELLVQIPNFDLGLDLWLKDDVSMVEALLVHDITPTWKNRGVEISVDNMCSTLFCAFWNKSYGNHYGGNRNIHGNAYFGPPQISETEFHSIKGMSPHSIAAILCDRAMNQEDLSDITFNHRNAWSVHEFTELLAKSRFKVTSLDSVELAARFGWIPNISKRLMWSQFYLASPVR